MDNQQAIIDAYFKIFKLDSRASQTELELAYDTLTKGANIPNSEIQAYRIAFEYLMCNFYKAVDIQDECENYENREGMFFDSVVEYIPESISSALDTFEELSDIDLTNKMKTIFATQTVCLPVFFNSIMTNCTKILGFKMWTKQNMCKVFNETVFNTLKYSLICIELSCDVGELYKKDEIISFMTALKNNFGQEQSGRSLCPKFTLEKTNFGCMSMILIENSFSEHLKNLVYNKSKILNCNCNMTTEAQT